MVKAASIKIKGMNTVIGIFLLIIGVSGNFIAETMSCQIQHLLNRSMFAKNLVLLAVIYFSLDFTSSEGQIHPSELATRTVWIWLFFILFNKMDLRYSVTVFIFLFYILVIKNYIDYYRNLFEDQDEDIPEDIQKKIHLAKKSSLLATIAIFLTMAIGFPIYLSKKRKKVDFSFLTFILGKVKCSKF